MSIYGDLKEVIQLLESVKDLKRNTEKLAEIVNDIDKRVVALERGEEVIIEKAASAASTAANYGVQKLTETTFDRLATIEQRLIAVDNARTLPNEDR